MEGIENTPIQNGFQEKVEGNKVSENEDECWLFLDYWLESIDGN